MGSMLTRQTFKISPNLAISYLRSAMIEKTNSINLEITNYDTNQITKMVEGSDQLASNRKHCILYVLSHNDFESHFPKNQRDIYFIDTYCNSVLHIQNRSKSSDIAMDRVMTVNLDVLNGLSSKL